jgi:hypothetical protein
VVETSVMRSVETMRREVRATICIPTVSRLGFFKESLESAVCQSFEDHEVLVSVNSPGPDPFPHDPIDAIPRFLQIADHANFMVNQGGGEYWCYLGGDDRMEPDFLETLVALLDLHAEAGFAFSGFQNIDHGTVLTLLPFGVPKSRLFPPRILT